MTAKLSAVIAKAIIMKGSVMARCQCVCRSMSLIMLQHQCCLQASPPVSISPDVARHAGNGPGQHPPVPHTAPPAQRSSMWLAPPPPVRTPSGLYAMLNPAGTGQSAALYDLLKSADNSPRSASLLLCSWVVVLPSMPLLCCYYYTQCQGEGQFLLCSRYCLANYSCPLIFGFDPCIIDTSVPQVSGPEHCVMPDQEQAQLQ